MKPGTLKTIRPYLCSLLGALITACAASPDPSVNKVIFTGRVMAGPISNSNVTIYKLNADGTRGATLGSVVSDKNGFFNLDLVAETGSGIAVATGGSYIEESGKKLVLVGSRELTSYLDKLNESRPVAVTPLTDMAGQHILSLKQKGMTLGRSVKLANARVSSVFKIFAPTSSTLGAKIQRAHTSTGAVQAVVAPQPVDISRVIPYAPEDGIVPPPLQTSLSVQVTAALGTLSQASVTRGTDSIDFVGNTLKPAFQDGSMASDTASNGQSISDVLNTAATAYAANTDDNVMGLTPSQPDMAPALLNPADVTDSDADSATPTETSPDIGATGQAAPTDPSPAPSVDITGVLSLNDLSGSRMSFCTCVVPSATSCTEYWGSLYLGTAGGCMSEMEGCYQVVPGATNTSFGLNSACPLVTSGQGAKCEQSQISGNESTTYFYSSDAAATATWKDKCTGQGGTPADL